MANEVVPYFTPGESLTARAAAALTGKRFVKVSATVGSDGLPVVNVPGAGDPVLGVLAQDLASGIAGLVYTAPGVIVPVTAGATVTAGTDVQVDAAGKVIPLAAGKKVGYALSDAANNADCIVKLG